MGILEPIGHHSPHHSPHHSRHHSPPLLFTLLFNVLLFSALPRTTTALSPGTTTEVDLKLDPSIYPCLDTYTLLVTKPDLSAVDYTRLVRVYVAQIRTTNLKILNYVREYKLPPSNLLNIDCQSFSASFKFYCFVYVALNASSGAVALRSLPVCRPTVLSEEDMDNSVDVQQPEEIDLETEARDLDTAGPSLNVRGGHYNGQNSLLQPRRSHSHRTAVSVDYEFAKPVDVDCNCLSGRQVQLDLSNTSLGANSVRLHISSCNSGEDVAPTIPVIDSVSHTTRLGNDRSITVCVLNLTQREATIVELVSPLAVIDALAPSLKVRDGQLAVDPLLRIASNGSIRHVLQSRYLRIESSRDMLLTLRFEQAPRKASSSLPDISRQEQKQSLLMDFLRPVHYSAFGFLAFTLAAVFLYALVCMSVRIKQPKVQIVVEGEAEPPPTSESHLPNSQAAMSDFSFADGDSLEMDYYDYHATLLPHSKSVSFSTSKNSDERNEPDKTSL